MNPYSPEQKHAKAILQHARERCRLEKENTELFIQHKVDMLARVRESIDAFDNEFGHEPIYVGNGIILPSAVEILEEEARYHGSTLDHQEDLLAEINEAEKTLDNALRRHKQNYDYKFEKFIRSCRQKPKNNSASTSSHD